MSRSSPWRMRSTSEPFAFAEGGGSLIPAPSSKDPTSDHIVLVAADDSYAGTIRWHAPTGKLGRLALRREHRGLAPVDCSSRRWRSM